MAKGPSSEHAAAVAIELKRHVRKVGEALHILRDNVYGKVSIAYSDKTETEQDAIGVEFFTNAIGDAEIVLKLLQQRPCTLAQICLNCSPMLRKPPAAPHQIRQWRFLKMTFHSPPLLLILTLLLLGAPRILGVVCRDSLIRAIVLKGQVASEGHPPSSVAGWLTEFMKRFHSLTDYFQVLLFCSVLYFQANG